jgi:DNA primase
LLCCISISGLLKRRCVRTYTGWGDTQLKLHLHRLEELEYLLVHHGGRGQSFVYELLFEREAMDGKPMLPGLIDVGKLQCDGKKSGAEQAKSGAGRGLGGGLSGSGRGSSDAIDTGLLNGFGAIRANGAVTGSELR